MTTDQNPDFDGCRRKCRLAGAHTLVWGECEHAPQPEPTVSLSHVYTDTDGHPSIGFDTYTVPELARLIEPVLGDPLKAAAAGRRIVHRHDEQPAAVPVPPPAQAERREQLLDALDFAYCQGLGYDTPEALVDAYDAERAVRVPPPADQTSLRQRIAEALATADGWQWAPGYDKTQSPAFQEYLRLADAVLAVLPEQTDRGAVLLWAADRLVSVVQKSFRDRAVDATRPGLLTAVEFLRRVAAEEQPAETRQSCACGQDGCEYCDVDEAVGEQPETQETP